MAIVGGSSGRLADAAVRDTRSRVSGLFGGGVIVEGGGDVDLERSAVESSRLFGVFAIGLDSRVAARDVVIRGTRGRALDEAGGYGAWAGRDSAWTAERWLVDDNMRSGIFAGQASVALADLSVRHTQTTAGTLGYGFFAQDDAVCSISRARFHANHTGAVVGGAGSTLTLEDVAVTDTVESGDGAHGLGMAFGLDASANLTRVQLERNRSTALLVESEGTVVLVTDLTVRDTRERAVLLNSGRAMSVQNGGVVEGTRVALERSLDVAAFVSTGAALRLSETTIDRVARRACVDLGCRPDFGIGAGAYSRGTLELTSFAIVEAETCGVHVADDGALDLHRGVVTDSAIGACVQVDGYDLDRLNDEVRYSGNGTNLDATTLPVPDPEESIGG